MEKNLKNPFYCPVATIIGGKIKVKNGEILGDAEGKPIVFN